MFIEELYKLNVAILAPMFQWPLKVHDEEPICGDPRAKTTLLPIAAPVCDRGNVGCHDVGELPPPGHWSFIAIGRIELDEIFEVAVRRKNVCYSVMGVPGFSFRLLRRRRKTKVCFHTSE